MVLVYFSPSFYLLAFFSISIVPLSKPFMSRFLLVFISSLCCFLFFSRFLSSFTPLFLHKLHACFLSFLTRTLTPQHLLHIDSQRIPQLQSDESRDVNTTVLSCYWLVDQLDELSSVASSGRLVMCCGSEGRKSLIR
jgi:hypothetical protein